MTRDSFSPYTIDVPGRETGPGTWRATPATARPKAMRRKNWKLRTGDFSLLMAGLAALGGMNLGVFMDFTLAPAHAHLNLLGWVTLALYGLYHRSAGRTGGWLGWSQVIAGALGAILMAGGLGLYLNSGHERFMPIIIVGSLSSLLGMILFLIIVLIEALGPGSRAGGRSRA
jgi:hypothetical protein